jgi:hypothetical protein
VGSISLLSYMSLRGHDRSLVMYPRSFGYDMSFDFTTYFPSRDSQTPGPRVNTLWRGCSTATRHKLQNTESSNSMPTHCSNQLLQSAYFVRTMPHDVPCVLCEIAVCREVMVKSPVVSSYGITHYSFNQLPCPDRTKTQEATPVDVLLR